MRGLCIAVLLAAAATAWAQADLLNDAAREALQQAEASLADAHAARPALQEVERVGVVVLDDEHGTAFTPIVRSALFRTPFTVIMTDDADWQPLLDEFARQWRRQDVILEETAHKLRVQGVDAVVIGLVEKASVEDVDDGRREGQRAEARLMLEMVSIAENNPGTLVWSEHVRGVAENLRSLAPEEQARSVIARNPILSAIVAGVLVLVVLSWWLRWMTRPV